MSSISYFLQSTRFRQIVGALQYLTFTCPDICFDGNRVCQFMHAPTDSHWAVVKRILRYLRGMTLHGLHITRSSSLPYMVLHMQIRQTMLRIENLRVVTLSSLVRRRFRGNPVSNAQLLALLLKLSTKP